MQLFNYFKILVYVQNMNINQVLDICVNGLDIYNKMARMCMYTAWECITREFLKGRKYNQGRYMFTAC
jgi:hypothetical protein